MYVEIRKITDLITERSRGAQNYSRSYVGGKTHLVDSQYRYFRMFFSESYVLLTAL